MGFFCVGVGEGWRDETVLIFGTEVVFVGGSVGKRMGVFRNLEDREELDAQFAVIVGEFCELGFELGDSVVA